MPVKITTITSKKAWPDETIVENLQSPCGKVRCLCGATDTSEIESSQWNRFASFDSKLKMQSQSLNEHLVLGLG